MTTTDYLVEMKARPITNVLSPSEAVALSERYVLPTLEACDRLVQEGRIVAGGPAVAGMSFTFVLRADSPAQVEEVVTALPIWARTETTIVPLTSFAGRAHAVRARVERLRNAAASLATSVNN